MGSMLNSNGLDPALRMNAIRHTMASVLRNVNGVRIPIWSLVDKLTGDDLRALVPGESVGDFVEFMVKEGLLDGTLHEGVTRTKRGDQVLSELTEEERLGPVASR